MGVYNADMLRPLWVSLRQLILPAHCAGCGAAAPPEGRAPLCDRCGRALAELLTRPYCPRCGRNAGPYTTGGEGCLFCRNYPVRFDAAARVGPYEAPLRNLILRLKKHGRVEIAPFLGRLLGEQVALAPWADRVEAIVPVPLHWSRRASRGFNQAALLARELGRMLGRRPARGRLRRLRPTPHQMLLPADQRRRNVRGAFGPAWRAADLKGKGVLLVDDVMTSGTTIGECVGVVRDAGAAEVYVAVVATADYDDPGPW
jgi:ComF family protein